MVQLVQVDSHTQVRQDQMVEPINQETVVDPLTVEVVEEELMGMLHLPTYSLAHQELEVDHTSTLVQPEAMVETVEVLSTFQLTRSPYPGLLTVPVAPALMVAALPVGMTVEVEVEPEERSRLSATRSLWEQVW